MGMEEFRGRVLEKLRVYARGKPEQELIEAVDEYADLVKEGYNHYQGIEYGYDYAAWNISMCI